MTIGAEFFRKYVDLLEAEQVAPVEADETPNSFMVYINGEGQYADTIEEVRAQLRDFANYAEAGDKIEITENFSYDKANPKTSFTDKVNAETQKRLADGPPARDWGDGLQAHL